MDFIPGHTKIISKGYSIYAKSLLIHYEYGNSTQHNEKDISIICAEKSTGYQRKQLGIYMLAGKDK